MSIRLTGMSSGLDTEAMITELMSAYSKQKHKKVSTMTKYSWKMDAWAELNKKVNSFFSKSLNNLKYSSTYSSKKTTVSDTTKASVTASNNAISGSQTLAIKQLAQSGYLTGGRLSKSDGSKVTDGTTLSALGYSGDDTSIEVNGKTISIGKNSKISDVVKGLQDAGVDASFDSNNSRIFVSSKAMGSKGDFSISANDTNGIKALADLGLYTGVSASASASNSKYASYVSANGDGTYSLTDAAKDAVNSLADSKMAGYKAAANSAMKILEGNSYYGTAAQEAGDAGLSGAEYYDYIKNSLGSQSSALDSSIDSAKSDVENTEKKISRLKELEDKKKKIEDGETDSEGNPIAWEAGEEAELSSLQAENSQVDAEGKTVTLQDKLDEYKKTQADLVAQKKSIDDASSKVDEYLSNTEKAEASNCVTEASAEILKKGQTAYESANLSANKELADYVAKSASSTAVRLDGQDAIIFLNGAEFSSSKNTFEINGMTINCKETTSLNDQGKAKLAAGQATTADDYNTVTLTTDTDTDGIYDSIKGFLKEYNALIKELDTAYNAESSKDYEVLSDEEKDALSDTEVEAWEKKIKDSLLRRDDSVSTLANTMKSAMAASYTVNGKSYSLSSFGINTLSYFLAADNEKSVYHIDGDADDADTSGESDKLKAAIASDPEGVKGFFTQLSQDLYSQMTKLSSTSSSRSFGNFYDDKAMKSQYSTYKTQLSDYETKLQGIEDKYYKQFSKMETALTKMQSNSSYLSSLMGM